MEENSQNIENTEGVKEKKNVTHGNLKIFMGYAPGVGKTYTMLNEGNRRIGYGEDVVIGFVESYGRKETEQQIGKMEVIPRKKIKFERKEYEEMDLEAIIRRKPDTVLIDEIAHLNITGSKNKKRYQDVEEILKNGINVITTLNIQHVESLNDIISGMTNKKIRDSIPDQIVQNADEVVVVDLTPEALLNRLKRGKILPEEKINDAVKNFFRKSNLTALRELSLRQIAEEVDEDLEENMKQEDISDNWRVSERIMVCISSNPLSKRLIRRGARIAKRYKCEWYVVYVQSTSRFAKEDSLKDKQVLSVNEKLAQQLGAEFVKLKGKNVSEEMAKWANEKHITQIILGYPTKNTIKSFFKESVINTMVRKVKHADIRLINY